MTKQNKNARQSKARLLPLAAALMAAPFLAVEAGHHDHDGEDKGAYSEKAKKDIVDTAVAADGFDTLVAAVKAAGLVETLKGDGPFTVFAPTDAAFAELPEETLESLLKPENKEKLASILTYHVVPGKVTSKDVKPMDVATVNGAKATIEVDYGTVTIDEAKVVQTDIMTSNGVIHVIDAVIMPPESK